MRHKLVQKIILAYEKYDRERREKHERSQKNNNERKDGDGNEKKYRPVRN